MIWKKQPVGSKLSDLQNNKASKDTATQSAAGLMSAADKTKLDKVDHTTIITATTLADLKTNLFNAVNGVDSGDMLAVRISPSFSSYGFASGATYGGYAYNIYKASGTTSYFSVILSNNIGEDMFIGYNNGIWKFNSLNSNKIQCARLTASVEISYPDASTIGYRTTESTKINIVYLTGYPSGKTILGYSVYPVSDIYGAILWVDNANCLRGTSVTGHGADSKLDVVILVFYL